MKGASFRVSLCSGTGTRAHRRQTALPAPAGTLPRGAQRTRRVAMISGLALMVFMACPHSSVPCTSWCPPWPVAPCGFSRGAESSCEHLERGASGGLRQSLLLCSPLLTVSRGHCGVLGGGGWCRVSFGVLRSDPGPCTSSKPPVWEDCGEHLKSVATRASDLAEVESIFLCLYLGTAEGGTGV